MRRARDCCTTLWVKTMRVLPSSHASRPRVPPATLALAAPAALALCVAQTSEAAPERVEDVPSSVSTFSAETLELSVRTNPGELLKLLPATPPVLPGRVSFEAGAAAYLYSIDGLWNDVGQAAGIPADGPISPDIVEQIQVLRGPAQALYGSGALAGSVSLVGERPEWCDFGTGLGPAFGLAPGGVNPLIGQREAFYSAVDAYWLNLGRIAGGPFSEDLSDAAWFGSTCRARGPSPVVQCRQCHDGEEAGGQLPKAREDLERRAGELKARQEHFDGVRKDLDRQLGEARSAGDVANVNRIQSLIGETTRIQDAIETESGAVLTALEELDRPQSAALDQRRGELMQQVNSMACEAIEKRIAWDETLQDAKHTVTTGTRWLSVGSELQHDTDRTTRMADRELASAEEKLKAVDQLLEKAPPGSTDAQILESSRKLLEVQRDGASTLLEANASLTKTGYVVDVALYASGVALVKVGKAGISVIASRALAPQAAERVIATSTERGVIELTKSALGRSGAQAAPGGASAASQAASRAAQEGGEWSLGSGSSEFFTGSFEIPVEVLAQEGVMAAERAAADDAYRQVLQEVERRMDLGESLDNILDDVLGTDVLPPPDTAAAREVGQLLDQAGQRGKEAFAKGAEQAQQSAAEAARKQALEKARQIMQQRWGGKPPTGQGPVGGGTTGLSAPDFRAASGLDPLGKTTLIWGSLPFIFTGLFAQDAHAADPVQGVADSRGNATLLLPVGAGQGGRQEIRLSGYGAVDSVNVIPKATSSRWQISLPKGQSYIPQSTWTLGGQAYGAYLYPEGDTKAVHKALKSSGLPFEENYCRNKKFAPLDAWAEVPAGASPATPYRRSSLRIPQ